MTYRIYLCGIDDELRAQPCPEGGPDHEPCPDGYLERAGWAQAKLKTHRQVRCEHCGLYAFWVPRKGEAGE